MVSSTASKLAFAWVAFVILAYAYLAHLVSKEERITGVLSFTLKSVPIVFLSMISRSDEALKTRQGNDYSAFVSFGQMLIIIGLFILEFSHISEAKVGYAAAFNVAAYITFITVFRRDAMDSSKKNIIRNVYKICLGIGITLFLLQFSKKISFQENNALDSSTDYFVKGYLVIIGMLLWRSGIRNHSLGARSMLCAYVACTFIFVGDIAHIYKHFIQGLNAKDLDNLELGIMVAFFSGQVLLTASTMLTEHRTRKPPVDLKDKTAVKPVKQNPSPGKSKAKNKGRSSKRKSKSKTS